MKQHFQIPWAQILIVCAALVMAFGMGTSVALKQDYVSNAGRETSPHPHVYLYLLALEETLLESNYLDLEALSQILTICRSLWDIETGLSYKEIMAQLEENVTSGDYQDALELLGISDMIPITTQGGT